MPIEEQAPPPRDPPPDEPRYITREEAKRITLGMKLRLRKSWPVIGGMGCGPDVEVIGISNRHHSQTQRCLLLRDSQDRIMLLDAAWCLPDDRLDEFYTP
jgi:hypothetical protein